MKEPVPSQTEARNDRSERLKRSICELLECLPEQYAEFQYQHGLRYLRNYLCDQHAADLLSRSRVFWSWWRNHWMNRDEEFLQLNEQWPKPKHRDTRIQLYIDHNDGKRLAKDIHPNSVVMNESYGSMILDLMGDDQDKSIQL